MIHQFIIWEEINQQISKDKRVVEDSNFTPRHLPFVEKKKVFLISLPSVTFTYLLIKFSVLITQHSSYQ